jgi:hypothetical protein
VKCSYPVLRSYCTRRTALRWLCYCLLLALGRSYTPYLEVIDPDFHLRTRQLLMPGNHMNVSLTARIVKSGKLIILILPSIRLVILMTISID